MPGTIRLLARSDGSAAVMRNAGIVWTDVSPLLVIDGNLATKPITTVQAGTARSAQVLHGDGYMEFWADRSGLLTNVYFGLTNVFSPLLNPAGEFAIAVLGNSGQFQINDGAPHNFIWVPNDRIRIAVESGVVKFYSNGALFYTSARVPLFPLMGYVKLFFETTRVWGEVGCKASILNLAARHSPAIALAGQATERRFNP